MQTLIGQGEDRLHRSPAQRNGLALTAEWLRQLAVELAAASAVQVLAQASGIRFEHREQAERICSLLQEDQLRTLPQSRGLARAELEQLALAQLSQLTQLAQQLAQLERLARLAWLSQLVRLAQLAQAAWLAQAARLAQARLPQARLAQARLAQARILQARLAQARLAQALLAQAWRAQARLAQARLAQAWRAQARRAQVRLAQARLVQLCPRLELPRLWALQSAGLLRADWLPGLPQLWAEQRWAAAAAESLLEAAPLVRLQLAVPAGAFANRQANIPLLAPTHILMPRTMVLSKHSSPAHSL